MQAVEKKPEYVLFHRILISFWFCFPRTRPLTGGYSSLRASPSARNLSGPYGEKGNTYSQWPDSHPSFVPQCVKQESHSLDISYDMNVKLNGHETGDFRQSATLSEVSKKA